MCVHHLCNNQTLYPPFRLTDQIFLWSVRPFSFLELEILLNTINFKYHFYISIKLLHICTCTDRCGKKLKFIKCNCLGVYRFIIRVIQKRQPETKKKKNNETFSMSPVETMARLFSHPIFLHMRPHCFYLHKVDLGILDNWQQAIKGNKSQILVLGLSDTQSWCPLMLESRNTQDRTFWASQ